MSWVLPGDLKYFADLRQMQPARPAGRSCPAYVSIPRTRDCSMLRVRRISRWNPTRWAFRGAGKWSWLGLRELFEGIEIVQRPPRHAPVDMRAPRHRHFVMEDFPLDLRRGVKRDVEGKYAAAEAAEYPDLSGNHVADHGAGGAEYDAVRADAAQNIAVNMHFAVAVEAASDGQGAAEVGRGEVRRVAAGRLSSPVAWHGEHESRSDTRSAPPPSRDHGLGRCATASAQRARQANLFLRRLQDGPASAHAGSALG